MEGKGGIAPHELGLVVLVTLVEVHVSLTFCGTCHSASSAGGPPLSGLISDGFLARWAFCMKRNPSVPLLNVFDITEGG